MAKVAAPMVSSEINSIDLRPRRSPKCPNNAAPTIRARYAEAKVPNASSVPISGTKSGKNTLLNTSAEAVANTNKSYHSTVVPITLATATFFMLIATSGGAPDFSADDRSLITVSRNLFNCFELAVKRLRRRLLLWLTGSWSL
ncbi:hypothetical protein PS893_03971 [Pseudomonas fluorescens]|nr:hypothetical protein PS893_03971 [Pseudomonas fluorescens]